MRTSTTVLYRLAAHLNSVAVMASPRTILWGVDVQLDFMLPGENSMFLAQKRLSRTLICLPTRRAKVASF